jgi:hypothetical protein
VRSMTRDHGTPARPVMLRMAVLLAVFAAAFAAFVVPAESSAAAPPGPPPLCWSEYDVYKVNPGQIVHATAFKDCADGPSTALSVSLQSLICDFFACSWVTVRSGYGHVSYKCSGDYYEDIRSTRLPTKVIRCYPT